MAIKFYKLMDILNRREISKEQLRTSIGISSATMSKLSSNKVVSLEVIDKICKELEVQPGDIMEYMKEEK